MFNQRKINNTVGVQSSQYTSALGSLTNSNTRTYWNNMSDQRLPHGQANGHTGAGVDIKHGSYARYLNKLKGKMLREQLPDQSTIPRQGNKVSAVGIIPNCICQFV
jgi:hypothetical protein